MGRLSQIGLAVLMHFLFISGSAGAMNPEDSASHCAESIRLFVPHLFLSPKGGEPALTFEQVRGRFEVSYFSNHPQFRGRPIFIGHDTGKRFYAEWQVRGDLQNIHYRFLFETGESGLQPQLNIHFTRSHPEVMHLRTRLWSKDNRVQDLNLVTEALAVLEKQITTGMVWNIDLNDPQTFRVVWDRVLAHMENPIEGPFQIKEDGKGNLLVLVRPLPFFDRSFLENRLADPDEGEEFQEEVYQAIYRLPWFHALLLTPGSSGFYLRVIPVVHKNYWADGDAISFRIRAAFR